MNCDIDTTLKFTKTITPKILLMAIVILLLSEDIMTAPWVVLSAAIITSITLMPIIEVTQCNNYTLIITIAMLLLLSSQIVTINVDMANEYKIMINKVFLFGGIFITSLNLILGGMAIVKIIKLKKKNKKQS